MSKPFENLIAINRNVNGDYYFIYKVPQVTRGMHGKTKGHVDELLIVGINQKCLVSYLQRELNKVEKTEEFYAEGQPEDLKETFKL